MAPRARARCAGRRLTARVAAVDLAVNVHDRKAASRWLPMMTSTAGLVLHDCTWHRHANGKEWISFQARSYEDPNGGCRGRPSSNSLPVPKKAHGSSSARRLRPFTPQPRNSNSTRGD
jgi:hypothetical protein